MSETARAVGVEAVSMSPYTPWFLTLPPEVQDTAIPRPLVVEAIERAVARHGVVAIGAPSGYGKSTVVAEWARSSSTPTAWLSLTRFDGDAGRVTNGVIAALHRVLDSDGHLTASGAGYLSPLASLVDAIARAVVVAGTPITLVVDQAEWADDLGASLVGALAAKRPPGLSLVLLSTKPAEDTLRDLGRPSGAGSLDARMLAFTESEVHRAARRLLGSDLDGPAAARLTEITGGWPIAVRIALLAREHGVARDIADYIEDAVLAELPRELGDFVRTAAVAAHLDGPLAEVLTGRPDAAAMLAECVRRGLFLDRFTRDSGRRVYVWHPAFRSALLASESARDPTECRKRHARVADALRRDDPLAAVDHYLTAGEAESAYETILETWLAQLQEGRSRPLDSVCRALPPHLADRPALLRILACCAWIDGDSTSAQIHSARAQAGTDSSPLEVGVSAIATILVTDDPAALREALDLVEEITSVPGALPRRLLAYALHISGYTELRLRRDTPRAIKTLHSALREFEAEGLATAAARTAGTLAFAHAFAGHLSTALEYVARARAIDTDEDEWHLYDSGSLAMTEGFVAYWRGDLPRARSALAPLVAEERGRVAYGSVALWYNALAAAASGDRTWQKEALERLREMPDTPILGIPWRAFRSAALSELAAARGRMADALRHADVALSFDDVPVPHALAIEMYRRAGRFGTARRLVAETDAFALTVPARTVLSLTDALLRDDAGRDDAHLALERALDLAAPEGIVQPFLAPVPEVGSLLATHTTWGTQHEKFVAECLARRQGLSHNSLSAREHEILSYLRTSLTISEIAQALYLSPNTVKTHVRSIYRKLGVSKRRDAVRVRL